MKVLYKRNLLYFFRIDFFLLLAMLLCVVSAAMLIIFNYGEHKAGAVFAIVMLVIMAIIALIVSIMMSRKDPVTDSMQEARRLMIEDLKTYYAEQTAANLQDVVFLRISAPDGRYHMSRGGISSFYYILGTLRLNGKMAFDIRGMSLVSPEKYQKRIRVALDEIKEVKVEKEPAGKKKKMQTIRIIGLDGEIRFKCRCKQGHEADDFVAFLHSQT